MRLDDFDFELPEDRIALRPAEPRDHARLLVVQPGGSLEDCRVVDLPGILRAGDLLVFNNTKVIPAQLTGARLRSPEIQISVTLLERIDESSWWTFAKPGRRLKLGDRVRFGHEGRLCLLGTLEASVGEKLEDGRFRLGFGLHGAYLDEAIAAIGSPPLPPYIAARRDPDERDVTDYQTVFAAAPGAVAAPTAGLHFTPELLGVLQAAGIAQEYVTLHVGPGTFLPVKTELISGHRMHAEWGEIGADVAERLNRARAAGGRIVAVGTTSLRLLESAADETGAIRPFSGETDIFIKPGYRFRAVDLLMTNFHLPRSTLFMLVAAFAGLDTMRAAYRHAVENGYRFYSYGDASLLHPERRP